MKNDSIIKVHEFYSRGAHYPLAELRPGDIVVSGSDGRYPGKGETMLYMAAFDDRCLISAQHELVSKIERRVRDVPPERMMDDAIRNELPGIVSGSLGDMVCYTYAGMKLCCDKDTYRPLVDVNARKITRANACLVMSRLIDDGIPTDVSYLLADDAAFAYFSDHRPVAFAGTHPVSGWSDRIGNVMVGTHRDFRGRGYGKTVVSATTGALLDQGRVAVYGTSEDNIASQRTALAVGYRMYCRVFEIRLASG